MDTILVKVTNTVKYNFKRLSDLVVSFLESARMTERPQPHDGIRVLGP